VPACWKLKAGKIQAYSLLSNFEKGKKMRADRLLSLLMLLQSKGRMNATELAEELEVSVRTVYRDIDALSVAGVPVYGEVGREGGFALLDSYRTSLTGLTDEELRVLFMLRIPEPLEDLGISTELKKALLKLSAAIPEARRSLEVDFRLRVHMDFTGWEQRIAPLPQLQPIYRAIRQDLRLIIRYQPMFGIIMEKWTDPYGLVAKGGDWHLVCSSGRKISVYRVSELLDVRVGEEKFDRPADFDVAVYWKEWCRKRSESSEAYLVTLRVYPALIPYLSQVFGSTLPKQTLQDGGSEGMVLHLHFESLEAARRDLLPLGGSVQVLAPRALRISIQDYAEQILLRYSVHKKQVAHQELPW
jgi:predicted DNA-binding transcriptional regulator YafY